MVAPLFNKKAAAEASEADLFAFWRDIVNGKEDKVSAFLKTYPDAWKIPVPHQDKDGWFGKGWTALHVAASHGQPALVRLFMSLGADIHAAAEDDKMTPLIMAACWPHHEGSAEVLKIALEKGSDVNAQGHFGNTALFYAAGHYLKNVAPLLEAGADPNTANSVGHTPLMVAAGSTSVPDPEVVKALLDRGARVNHDDIHGNNALSIIAHSIEIGRMDLYGERFTAIEAMLKEKSRAELLDEIEQIVTEGTGVTEKPMPLLRLTSPKPG